MQLLLSLWRLDLLVQGGLKVTSYYVETVVACVAIMQPCFVWIFVYFSGSQHLLSFVTLFFLFLFLCVDLMLRF